MFPNIGGSQSREKMSLAMEEAPGPVVIGDGQYVGCKQRNTRSIPGWWLGPFFIFRYIGNNHPNGLIFFKMVETTNQIQFGIQVCLKILSVELFIRSDQVFQSPLENLKSDFELGPVPCWLLNPRVRLCRFRHIPCCFSSQFHGTTNNR